MNKFYKEKVRFLSNTISIFTHEARNHLAIIRESTGLISDMLQFNKDIDKTGSLIKPLEQIESQALKTIFLLKTLSSFSKRLYNEDMEFDVVEVIEELLYLIQRSLHQKEIVLKKTYPNKKTTIKGNPSALQNIIFCIFETLQGKSSVEMNISDKDAYLLIELTYDKDLIGEILSNNEQLIRQLSEESGCNVESSDRAFKLQVMSKVL